MSPTEIQGAHFGERFQLFVIIVLGGPAGATASETGLSPVLAALLLALLSFMRSGGCTSTRSPARS